MAARLISFLEYSQEFILIILVMLVYLEDLFLVLTNPSLFTLNISLLLLALLLGFALLVQLIRQSKLYFRLLYYRLGFVLVLLLYMILLNRLCMFCMIYHLITISFSMSILLLNRNVSPEQVNGD